MDTRNPKESNKILTTFDEQDGIHNTNIEKLVPMIPPACMLEEIPITKKAAQTVLVCRTDISNILTGNDNRILLVLLSIESRIVLIHL